VAARLTVSSGGEVLATVADVSAADVIRRGTPLTVS